jgi:hypothetical protein
VAKAWQRAGLQPHRFERDMQSDDPVAFAKTVSRLTLTESC